MMENLNPTPLPQEEMPADPGTDKALRRGLLLVALLILLAPCGLCWYSTTLEAVELALIPGGEEEPTRLPGVDKLSSFQG